MSTTSDWMERKAVEPPLEPYLERWGWPGDDSGIYLLPKELVRGIRAEVSQSFGHHWCGGVMWTAPVMFKGVTVNGHRCDQCGGESIPGSELDKLPEDGNGE